MKTFEALFNKNQTKGVYGISLVENPAMQGMFVALSENEVKLAEVDKEKRILLGMVLEPNKLVYRNSKEGGYNIVFNEETIEQLAHNFYQANYQANSTIEHTGKRIEGVTFVESWVVENEDIDKQKLHGLNHPKGSWMVKMKVDNDTVWNDYVKTGKVKGFSIDGLIELKEIKTEVKMGKTDSKLKDAFNSLGVALGLTEAKEVETKEVETELKTDEVATEVKEEVKLMDETQVLAKVQEMLTAFKAEVMAEIEGKKEPTMDDKKEEIAMTEEAKANEVNELEEIKKMFAGLKEELVELKNQPKANPIKSAPTQVEFSKMTELQKRKYFRKNA